MKRGLEKEKAAKSFRIRGERERERERERESERRSRSLKQCGQEVGASGGGRKR
jgi:hypothetical protein